MVLLSRIEVRDWARRIIWSGIAAVVMAHSSSAPLEIGHAWAVALAVFLAEDMAAARGLALMQRLVISMVAAVPALLMTSLIGRFLN